jgi:hypothetical protein
MTNLFNGKFVMDFFVCGVIVGDDLAQRQALAALALLVLEIQMIRIWSALSIAVMSLLLMAASATAQDQARQDRSIDDVYDIIEDFVREDYLSSWFASPGLIRQHFVDPLDYYWGKKKVPQKMVLQDKVAYVTRWPQRYYRLIDDSLQVARTAVDDNTYAINFQYEFETKRPGDVRAGIGETNLLIELRRGRIMIRGEGGRVVERY